MNWRVLALCSFLAFGGRTSYGQVNFESLARQHWFELRAPHFNIYSCAGFPEVRNLATRLEQFHDAYSMLAGVKAVASPPIVVLAFPNHAALEPFLPVYKGQPANLAAFFLRGEYESLIVLGFSSTESDSLDTIFHEYSHSLFRHNDRIWPLWLQEGMAEMYSTFEATGRGVRIGKPIEHHLRLLARNDLMPLHELMGVTHDSPQYNESDRQGVFYAESWLLTHFLMNGDNPALKARFGQFTKLLKAGQPAEQAFTNALGMSLTMVEAQLRRYLERGQFESLAYLVSADLDAPRAFTTRPATPVEVCFRLGNELSWIDRTGDAEAYFNRARTIAPASPLPYEGLGLLAVHKKQPARAVELLKQSMDHGSASFLTYVVYGEQRLLLKTDSADMVARIPNGEAAEIRSALERSLGLMPDFAETHKLLGLLEYVQGGDLDDAERQLQRAMELDPEDDWLRLQLAEVQWGRKNAEAARQTLEALRLPMVNGKVRARAEEMLREMDHPSANGH